MRRSSSQTRQPEPQVWAIVLDTGDRGNENIDYRVLGAALDPNLAEAAAQSLTASIRSAAQALAQFDAKERQREEANPTLSDGMFARRERRLKRVIPNALKASITYGDVQDGARVRTQRLAILRMSAPEGEAQRPE